MCFSGSGPTLGSLESRSSALDKTDGPQHALQHEGTHSPVGGERERERYVCVAGGGGAAEF